MCRVALRAGAWALAGAVMITLAAGCSASTQAPPSQGPGRQIFTMKMVTDHRKLDRGVLAYSALTSMPVRQATLFEVEVTDVGRGPETSPFIRQSHGWVVDVQNVPTGGTVSVRVVCGTELACVPRTSSARQPILRPGQSATWAWDITARSPGDAQIVVIAVSYRGDSRVVASQTSATAGVNARSTPLYSLEAAIDARKSAVIFVAADLLALVAILAAVLIVRRRMTRGQRSPRAARLWTAWLARRRKAHPDGPGEVRPGPDPSASPGPDLSALAGPDLSASPGPDLSALPGPDLSASPGPDLSASPGPDLSASPVPDLSARPGLGRRAWLGLRDRAWPGLRDRTRLGPRGRAWLGLAAIEAAVAALVFVLVRHVAAKPLSFAIIAAAVAVVLLPVYFLPVFIARARRVPDLAPVTVINVFLGWTFFGWVAALALAVRERRPEGPAASAEPALRSVPEPMTEPLARAVSAAVPRMRPRPADSAGAAVTLVIWQTPDNGLTCQDPGDSWVHRWTYGVSPGPDGAPRFVLTGERHGCLVPLPRERPER